MRDTIDMAREAGFWQEHINTYMCSTDAIKAFEALVRADEREQAEERVTDMFENMETPYLPDIVAAIRGNENI
jgi:hypothetical protein